MKSAISERIELLINRLGMNKNSFSKAIGITNNVTIGNIVKHGQNPSLDVIQKILHKYSNVNADWLIIGNGEMLNIANKSKINSDINIKGDKNSIGNNYYSDSPDVLKQHIAMLNGLLEEKDIRIKEKDSQIKEKDSQIKDLLQILKQK